MKPPFATPALPGVDSWRCRESLVDVRPFETEQPCHQIQVMALSRGQNAVVERDLSKACQVAQMQMLDVDAGEFEGVRSGHERIGLGSGDVAVKERLVEDIQVGVSLRLVQAWQPVDKAGQKVLFTLAGGAS